MPFRGTISDAERQELRDVYRQNVSSVYAFFAYSVDTHTAEELTAATFERVVRSWRRYDPARATVAVWVLAIARNLLTDHYRRQSHRTGPSLDEWPSIAANLCSPDDPAEEWLGNQVVAHWLRELHPREREVLALRYGADLSAEEIAQCLGLTRTNVHQISSRALRRLRDVVGETDVSDSVSPDGGRLAAGI